MAGIWSKSSENKTTVAKRTTRMEPLVRIIMLYIGYPECSGIGKGEERDAMCRINHLNPIMFRLSKSSRNFNWHTFLNLRRIRSSDQSWSLGRNTQKVCSAQKRAADLRHYYFNCAHKFTKRRIHVLINEGLTRLGAWKKYIHNKWWK